MSDIQDTIASFGVRLHQSARNQERLRILEIISDKICLDRCQHAVCRELTQTIREINRGKDK